MQEEPCLVLNVDQWCYKESEFACVGDSLWGLFYYSTVSCTGPCETGVCGCSAGQLRESWRCPAGHDCHNRLGYQGCTLTKCLNDSVYTIAIDTSRADSGKFYTSCYAERANSYLVMDSLAQACPANTKCVRSEDPCGPDACQYLLRGQI